LGTLAFSAKYDYLASQSGIEVPIGLSIAKREVRLLAKVDTGAAFCIFQREYGEQLGIDVESGQYQKVRTQTGTFDTFGHTVNLSCLDWQFETMVYFAALKELSRNVVGRVGWLEHFRLGLIDQDSVLFLSGYDD
jgi:hypothetical protein